jgi:hypothetical protein
VPANHQERSFSRSFWLLAVLLLGALAFFLVRRGYFTQQGPARRPSNSAGEQRENPARPAQPAPSTGGTAGYPAQFSAAAPASDSWYTSVAFKGVVLNERDETPVAGAKVRILACASPAGVMEKLTDSAGAFQMQAPPAHRYEVKVEASGFRPFQQADFVLTRPYYDLRIPLTPLYRLHGRVVDGLSAGIADAVVQLRRGNERSVVLLQATTDPEGAFTLTDIPADGRYWVEARHSGYDPLGLISVGVPTDAEAVLRMKPVQAAGSLSGTVTDFARKPVAHAGVSLADQNNQNVSDTQTDPHGAFRFGKVREGYYLLRCSADGYSASSASQAVVKVLANREARMDMNLEGGRQIQGQVVNQKGEPVIGAQITCSMAGPNPLRTFTLAGSDPTARRMSLLAAAAEMQRGRSVGVTDTDTEGRFQISGLADTQYQITISHRDYLDLVTRLRPSGQPLTLTLDSGLSLRGTISDSQGTAIEAFVLSFHSTSVRSDKSYSFLTTDGHFEIDGLARDRYQVILNPSGPPTYAGSLDMQSSIEVVVVLQPPHGGRGWNALNFLKVR